MSAFILTEALQPSNQPAATRKLAITAVLGGMMLVVLDAAIANIALPQVAAALAISPAIAVRIVTGYQLGVMVALLPAAALGESVGYPLVFRGGAGLFVVASVLCAAAPSIDWLVAARVLQGIGGAGVLALGVALLRSIVPASRFGSAIGWNAMTVALSSAAGPTLGALILTVASWPWLFLVNLPLGLAVLFACRSLPVIDGTGAPVDLLSMALNVGTLGCLVAGGEMLPTRPPLAIALLVAGILCGGLLIARQARLATPLIPLDLLGQARFGRAVTTSVLCFAGQTSGLIAFPFFLHEAIGMSPRTIAACLTLWPLSVASIGSWAGRWSDTGRTGTLCLAGSILLCGGFTGALLFPLERWPLAFCACTISGGLGFGMFNVANNRRMFMAASPERSGSAGGLQGMARLIGQTLGGMLLTALFASAEPAVASRLGLLVAASLTFAAGAASLANCCAKPKT